MTRAGKRNQEACFKARHGQEDNINPGLTETV
jgi:hypothetical protein